MAAGFLITRMLLVFLLSEQNYSTAFPRDRSSVYSEAWQALRETRQEGHGYGNRRPLHYIQALRQPHRRLQANVYDQVRVKSWQKPPESSLKVRSHAQKQNQPGWYHQTQSPYQPWSDDATKWAQGMSPPEPPPQRNHPLSKPRSFEFSLKVPFANFPGQNKETTSTTKLSDAGLSFQSYRPSSFQIYSSFNSPSASDVFSDKGSSNGQKNAHDVSKPSLQLSLSVPIPSTTTATPKPSSSNGGYLANLQRPGVVDFIQSSHMMPAKPQSSSAQGGSEWIFLNSASTVQQQREHQTYESSPTKHTDSELITSSPGHASQHITSTGQINQGKIPTEQSWVFPKLPSSSLPVPQYPLLQSDSVHNSYYSAQINLTTNGYGKGQSGQTVSTDPTNVHFSVSPSQYEQVPSGHDSAGQVKPYGNNYGQPQTWQPVGAKQNAVPDQLTAFDPLPNLQGLSTDYQTQMRLPGQYSSSGQLDEKPKYTKLFIDVEDVMDGGNGQYNYIAVPPTYYDGYSHNMAETFLSNSKPPFTKLQSLVSVSQDQLTELLNPSYIPEYDMPIYNQTPSMNSGVGQQASNHQKQMEMEQIQTSALPGQAHYGPHMEANVGSVPTNFGQQQLSEPAFHTIPEDFSPSDGQYPVGQLQLQQPISGQRSENNYPISVNRINLSNAYSLDY